MSILKYLNKVKTHPGFYFYFIHLSGIINTELYYSLQYQCSKSPSF